VRPSISAASLHAFFDLGLGYAGHLEGEADVVAHGHVRVQRVVLEHHRDVALAGWHVVDHPLTDRQGAVADLLEAGDHAQRGGLAAARRADQHHELAVVDLEVEIIDGLWGRPCTAW
jgi:hypothetical protein